MKLFLSALLVVSAKAWSSPTLSETSSTEYRAKNIVELAVATPELSTLVAALKAADLVDTLSGKGPFTVFAPTNKAFAALPAGVLTRLLKPENKAQLVDLLLYHVASGDVHAKDLSDKEMIKTVEGKDVTVRLNGGAVFINSAKVITADVEASNGVVHIIDAVLMPGSAPSPAPSPSPKTIVDLAVATPELSTLVTALKAADLVGTLSGEGPFTVFAPTNEAFAKLPAGVLASLLKPENKAELVDLLTYHVASGEFKFQKYMPKKLIKSVEGKDLTVTSRGVNPPSFYVNEVRLQAKRSERPVTASNGIIYIINDVLTEPAPTPKTIVDLAVATADLSTLVTALKAADLVGTLSGKGPFTVFAPTNEAFAALPAGVLASLLKPENKAQLVDLLTYHVASGNVQAKDVKDGEMIKTVEGKDVTARVAVDGSIFINSAKVTTANVEASNGVVHIIDAVLEER